VETLEEEGEILEDNSPNEPDEKNTQLEN